MSLILHLSDLHLGPAADWQQTADDKIKLPDGDTTTHQDVLRHTLAGVGRLLKVRGQRLDTVVISGDVTKANDEEGMRALPPLLDLLGADVLPEAPNPIIVVPGNHDVDWREAPSDPAKYTRFVEHLRQPGYATPLLDGVDFDRRHHDLAPPKRARPVIDLGDAILVCLNSSNYCGVHEGNTDLPWKDMLDTQFGETGEHRERAQKQLDMLRLYDMARISQAQIDALLHHLEGLPPVDADPRLRVAVLHHHLLPVSLEEEVKPFESFTNLARIRQLLRNLGIHLVLHGHKHESSLGWDYVDDVADKVDGLTHRVLVVASPGRFTHGNTVCRLIATGDDAYGPPVAGAPRARITELSGILPEQQLDDSEGRAFVLGDPPLTDETPATVIHGRTVDAVYERLLAMFERDLPRQQALNVVCVVEDAESAEHVPAGYKPRIEGDLQQWLDSTVEWWQKKDPELVRLEGGPSFNHGQRLYGSADGDRIARAARRLGSTRATALLLDPASEAGMPDDYPSLVAVQLVLAGWEGDRRLDCVGYFRKQDVHLWWPVNVAELAKIQQRALEAVAESARPRPGRLVTITAVAVTEAVLPQLAGTAIDRAVDLRPEWLRGIAYAAAHPAEVDTGAALVAWREAFADVISMTPERLVVPLLGVKRLLEEVDVYARLQQAPRLATLMDLITRFVRECRCARRAQQDDAFDDPEERKQTAQALQEQATAVIEEVQRLLGGEV